MSKAKSPRVRPTYTGYIATSKDALIIFQAVLSGYLIPVHRRPSESERAELIKSGNVFVFIEETSGIKRWTDGTSWSPSRILGRFLIYRELSKNTSSASSSTSSSTLKDNTNQNNNSNTNSGRGSPNQTGKILDSKTDVKENDPFTPSSSTKTNNYPITAYAMAGGKEIISDINKRKRGRDEDSSDLLSNSSSDNLSTRGPSALDDTIYRNDGLIKKSMSLTLYNNTNYKKTIHLVSYYQSNDVLGNLLKKPSNDDNLKNIDICFDLLESLRNTSLGHAVSNKRNGELSIESHGFMDTDGFDEDTILKFAKEYYNKYNLMNKRRQFNPVYHQNYDPYRGTNMNVNMNMNNYYVNDQYDPLNQYNMQAYTQPQQLQYNPQQQQQQSMHQQQPQQQQPIQQQFPGKLGGSNYGYKTNYGYKNYDYGYQPVYIPDSNPAYGNSQRGSSISAQSYLPNSQRSVSESISGTTNSPPTSYSYSNSNSYAGSMSMKNQRSPTDDQYLSANKLVQLHQPVITSRSNYDVYHNVSDQPPQSTGTPLPDSTSHSPYPFKSSQMAYTTRSVPTSATSAAYPPLQHQNSNQYIPTTQSVQQPAGMVNNSTSNNNINNNATQVSRTNTPTSLNSANTSTNSNSNIPNILPLPTGNNNAPPAPSSLYSGNINVNELDHHHLQNGTTPPLQYNNAVNSSNNSVAAGSNGPQKLPLLMNPIRDGNSHFVYP